MPANETDASGRETASSSYSLPLRSNPPESVPDESGNLILGTSRSGALLYGLTLSEHYKACICADDREQLKAFYKNALHRITQHSGRRIVFIDDDSRAFKNTVEECPSCRYISGATELDAFIEELKPELNARLEEPAAPHEQLLIVIAEFNDFFKTLTDEQAAFMRKVFRYIDSPQYKICFLCGFDVNGEKNNDGLFMSLIVNAESYVLCADCYKIATAKIETLPLIPEAKSRSCYFCLEGKTVEIRW